MDSMNENNPSIESTNEVVSTVSETNGNSSENVVSVRTEIDNAKKRMFGDGLTNVHSEQSKAGFEGKGEEDIIEDSKNVNDFESTNENEKPKTDDKLQKLREKDKKQIAKLTAQKYSLKEANAKLQAEIEAFKNKMSKEPDPSDYDDSNAYNRAKIRYDMELENGISKFTEANKMLTEHKHAEWTDRCQSTVKDYNKFSENYSKYYDWLVSNEPELMNFASQTIAGPRLIEEAFNDLFASEDRYASWKAMSSQGRIQYLTRVEPIVLNEINGGNRSSVKENVRRSNAPVPIAPDKTKNTQVASKAVSMKEQIERAKRKLFA